MDTHFHRAEEFIPPLRQWHDEGRLVSRFDETPGLENTLAAYAKMLERFPFILVHSRRI